MWKQFVSVGLVYNIKVIDSTAKHRDEFSKVYSSKVLFVIMVQVQFFRVSSVFCLVVEIYSSLIFVTVQQSGIPSALHRLWEIDFNFANDISRILIGIFQLQKFGKRLFIWSEWRKKRESKIDDNRAFILVIFH